MRRSFLFVILTTALASCISLIGGIGLEATTTNLLPLVPLVVALPALNTMVGDYAAIIAAHAGDPGERGTTKRELAGAISRAIVVNIIGVLILSIVIAAKRGYVFAPGFMLKFGLFVPFAMLSITAFMFILTAILDKQLEKHSLNPDDVLIPVVTSITDVLMLGLIATAAVTIF